MPVQQYSVNQYSIDYVLALIHAGQIAIPEIQRPFVWNAAKVRDFIDSLYNGYPVGYLIGWKSADVRLKDGSNSIGKQVLIDGQQRVMALLAALMGQEVVGSDYKRVRIAIAFHPGEEKFEVTNPAIRRDRSWIPDIAVLFAPDMKILDLLRKYCSVNPEIDEDEVYNRIERLKSISGNTLGLIDLNADLDVETVAEIFVRINSKGTPLNAADFAMSKMAANDAYDGHLLRKCIDYFSHLVVAPEAYAELSHDKEFAHTSYFQAMRWLKDEKDDLYEPSYTDMLRVALATEFKRGRLSDLVALLSGRNFETHTFEERIAEESFLKLKNGVLRFMNETHFKRLILIIRSAGFENASLIRSQNTINFAYILYLTLRAAQMAPAEIESIVRRWFVMSILTGRYTNAPETSIGVDMRNIDGQRALSYLQAIEKAELSDTFWKEGLPQQMDTPVASSPYFNVFLAAQVKAEDKGFLSREIKVSHLLQGQSHVHHVFPSNYLKTKEFSRNRYNQIANYVVMQPEINIAIGDKPPKTYFGELVKQVNGGPLIYGGIQNAEQLMNNLATHCIPHGMEHKTSQDYDGFLQERRKLMALKMRLRCTRLYRRTRMTTNQTTIPARRSHH